MFEIDLNTSPDVRRRQLAASTKKFAFLNHYHSAQGLQGKDFLDYIEQRVDLSRIYRFPELLAVRIDIEDMIGRNAVHQTHRDELHGLDKRLQYLATEPVVGGQWTFSKPWVQPNGWRELVSTTCLFSYDVPTVWFDWPLDQNAYTKLRGWLGKSPIGIRWAEPWLDYLCWTKPGIENHEIQSALRQRMATIPNALYDVLSSLDGDTKDLPSVR